MSFKKKIKSLNPDKLSRAVAVVLTLFSPKGARKIRDAITKELKKK